MRNTGDPFLTDTNRVFHVDVEDLAELGVPVLLREIAPFLERVGVRLKTVREIVTLDPCYSIVLNESVFELYSGADDPANLSWGESAMSAYAVVNGLLEQNRVEERLYYRAVDDEEIAFLTTRMCEAIATSGIVPESWALQLAGTRAPASQGLTMRRKSDK